MTYSLLYLLQILCPPQSGNVQQVVLLHVAEVVGLSWAICIQISTSSTLQKSRVDSLCSPHVNVCIIYSMHIVYIHWQHIYHFFSCTEYTAWICIFGKVVPVQIAQGFCVTGSCPMVRTPRLSSWLARAFSTLLTACSDHFPSAVPSKPLPSVSSMVLHKKIEIRGGRQSCWSIAPTALVSSCELNGNSGFFQWTRREGTVLLRTYNHLVVRQKSWQISLWLAKCFLLQWLWYESYAHTNACIRTAGYPGFICKLPLEYAGMCKAYASHIQHMQIYVLCKWK